MQFGEFSLDEAEGTVLAHGLRTGGLDLRKGTVLDAHALADLRAAGIERVTAARLETDDVGENEAALRLALALAGPGLDVQDTRTGRVNLHANAAGLLVLDPVRVDALNAVHEAATLATLPELAAVAPGDMAATVKIIAFAVSSRSLAACLDLAAGEPVLRLAPYRPLRVALVQTVLDGTSPKMLDKTSRITAERIEAVGGTLDAETRIAHAIDPLARAIAESDADLVLIAGASAVQDRGDVIPAAIVRAGGRIGRFGMPVDPGNLLLLAEQDGRPVIGLPGCARSPKLNGFDWVLRRVAAGLPLDGAAIAGMGVGGLLAEIPGRPQPRERVGATAPKSPRIAAVVLAAGRSRRMSGPNKLLMRVDGLPLVRRTVEAALGAGLDPIAVVTGHMDDAVRSALDGLDVETVHNPDYADGLSTSLRAGLGAVDGADAALVVLGDMPGVDDDLLRRLAAAYDPGNGRRIVVPTHKHKRGNPILWDGAFFPAMRALKGDVGAKALMADNPEAVVEVEVETDAPLLDLDTRAAWDAYLERGE